MPEKPTTAEGYDHAQTELVRATCLYVATKLGDLMDDLVVVGGLVPSLLIDQDRLPAGAAAHVGTQDLDIGLSVALLDDGLYRTLSERLRRAEFEQDENDGGRPTRQRWKHESPRVTIDFLIPPTRPDDRGGRLRDIEADFAAIIAPGLHLAFRDQRRVRLSGRTIMGAQATRDVSVCGAGAYVVLKALAFDSRGENKDAYDLYYVLRNYGAGVEDVAGRLQPLLGDESAGKALAVLERDFSVHDSVGPRSVAEFLTGGPEDSIQADVMGFISDLLAVLRA